MPRLSKQESEELARHIEEVERYAAETDRILSGPADYQKVLYELLQEQGKVPEGVSYAQAADRHSPVYMPVLKRVYDSIRNRKSKEKKQPKPRGTARYKSHHVKLGTRETTVSLHPTLETMLALHLDMQPGTPAARKAVRAWMQDRLDQHRDPARSAVSHWLQGVIIEELVSSNLKKKYDEWLLEG
jgi:hypothetical protein